MSANGQTARVVSPRPLSDPAQRAGQGSASAREGAARDTLLVYRHRLAPLSEVGFLRRFYIGFEHLAPVWLGYHLDAGVGHLPGVKHRLGRAGPFGAFDRILFRHCAVPPPAPDLRALKPRLIHAHFGPGGAVALPLARALAIPLVVTFHGADASKETHYRRRVVPHIYQRRLAALQAEAALFVCVSEFVRDRLIERGFPRDKLAVIHQGVDLDAAPAATRDAQGDPYILFVGRLVEKKGVAHLLQAMRLLTARRSGVRLVVVGDGPLAAVLRREARGMTNVEFRGWLANAEVRRSMRGALALCVPSVTGADGDTEGLPTVIFEAMAEGLPVVASRHAGIAEAVEEERTGLLVPEGDPLSLAGAIQRLVDEPELQRRFAAAARTAASERFDAVAQSKKLEAALLRVLA